MIRICKIVATSALLLGSFATGSASTLTLGSFGTTAANPGFDNTSTSYLFAGSTVNTGSSDTYDISAGSQWHDALGSSSWVSFSPSTGPTGGMTAPLGDYIYSTTFSTPSKSSGGPYLGSLTVLADDTLSVYLNGVLIQASAGPMGATDHYTHCSDVGPNCLTPFTFDFVGILDGINTLTFDVKQVNWAYQGLDYQGTVVSTVPEPGSLTLMGTGIAAMAGLVRRRFAK